MKLLVLSLAGAMLLLMAATASAQGMAGNSSGSGDIEDGSGLGSGVLNCDMLNCSNGQCNETNEGPLCYCPIGQELGDDDRTCQVCRGGYWGMACSQLCQCGTGGNPCNAVTGVCECNPCYDGVTCENDVGYTCFTEFLAIEDKEIEALSRRYGREVFPTPPTDTLEGLVATELMEIDANIVEDVALERVDRTEVDQAPLATLSWRVNFNINRPEAEEGLVRLEGKVKVGGVRATLIVQELADYADVTLNAGVSL